MGRRTRHSKANYLAMSSKGSAEIARIKGKKDAYEILGLSRSSDLDDAKVKKAYKKLALLLHPGIDLTCIFMYVCMYVCMYDSIHMRHMR